MLADGEGVACTLASVDGGTKEVGSGAYSRSRGFSWAEEGSREKCHLDTQLVLPTVGHVGRTWGGTRNLCTEGLGDQQLRWRHPHGTFLSKNVG